MNKKAILIYLSNDIVDQLDKAAEVLRLTRVDVIRRSLQRDLGYITERELDTALRHHIAQDDAYSVWARGKKSHAGPTVKSVAG